MGQTYDIAGPSIAAEEFDGEYVVLDLANGMYYSVGPAASVIFRALLAGHDVESLKGALPAGDVRAEQIDATVTTFTTHGLVVARDREPTGGADIFAAELLAREADFNVEAFGDLADLLLADPIHDVDAEVGWPKRPDATGA